MARGTVPFVINSNVLTNTMGYPSVDNEKYLCEAFQLPELKFYGISEVYTIEGYDLVVYNRELSEDITKPFEFYIETDKVDKKESIEIAGQVIGEYENTKIYYVERACDWDEQETPCLIVENLSSFPTSVLLQNVRVDGEPIDASTMFSLASNLSETTSYIDLIGFLEGACFIDLTDANTVTLDVELYNQNGYGELIHTIKDFEINVENLY